jgi:hypothetical protein|tara:strand:- start:173 stop:355 length:183 start_codon:yes stop_codon:yes gene_type:complete
MASFIRHQQTKAVLNTDVAALNKYKQERALHTKVSKLSNEVNSIRELLVQVCDRLDRIEK